MKSSTVPTFGRARRRGGAVVLIVLALLSTACTGGEEKPATPAAEPLPDDQQVLAAATPGDVYITRDRVALGIWPDNANICETLTGLSEKFEVTPALATRWTYQGNNTYRFELRRNVSFHNGTPLTAEAVRYSLNRAVDKKIALQTFLGPDSAKVVDEHTVDVTPTQPNLRLPEQLALLLHRCPGHRASRRAALHGPLPVRELLAQ